MIFFVLFLIIIYLSFFCRVSKVILSVISDSSILYATLLHNEHISLNGSLLSCVF